MNVVGRIVVVFGVSVGAILRVESVVAQETARVNVDSAGNQSRGNAYSPSISGDGRFVAFTSTSEDLVDGDTNRKVDVFVHDRATGVTERVSVSSDGTEADGDSGHPMLSADGRFVAFESGATNLVSGDTNRSGDIFVRDRSLGTTERVSVDSSGVQAGSYSSLAGVSADGQVIAFTSIASNLVSGDSNQRYDAFVHDRSTGVTERVSVDSSGAQGDDDSGATGISADGRVVVFASTATNLVPDDTNAKYDVFVHDRTTNVTERVSIGSSGEEADDDSYRGVVSGDGSVVAFTSLADNLYDGDVNDGEDVFVRDRRTGITELVTLGSFGTWGYGPSSPVSGISPDGRFVLFASNSGTLVDDDDNEVFDVFVRDRSAGITDRFSVESRGGEANDHSNDASMSSDGQVVAFHSWATNLVEGDTNGYDDVFVHERCPLDATWTNEGDGFPGTFGVPAFTARSVPTLGTSLTLDLANSLGNYTFGLLFVGTETAQIHSTWGGDLLLLPLSTVVLGLAPTGTAILGDIPRSDAGCGVTLELQAIESDAGAARGVSFTQRLELRFGR
jgi:Tol biopolymer transport system component